jgi:hypothetical protein
MGFKNGEFSWHVWHKDPKTGIRKYCGSFYNDKAALGFKRDQKNPEEFQISNIGPSAIAKASQPKPSSAAERLREKRRQEQAARYERARRGESTSVTPPKPKAKPQPETAEQKKMKADAADMLEQHKADEQADLEQGINR